MKTSSKFHKALRSKRKVLPLIKLMGPGSSPPDTGPSQLCIRISRFDADRWEVMWLSVQVSGPGRFDRLHRENPFVLRPDPARIPEPTCEYVEALLGNRNSLTFDGVLRRGDTVILTHSPSTDYLPQDYWSELPLAVSAPSCELSRTFVYMSGPTWGHGSVCVEVLGVAPGLRLEVGQKLSYPQLHSIWGHRAEGWLYQNTTSPMGPVRAPSPVNYRADWFGDSVYALSVYP